MNILNCNHLEEKEPPTWFKILCFIIVILMILGVTLFGVTDESRDSNAEPKDILIADSLHGLWLTIGRINHKDPQGEFNPNWTYLRTEPGIIPVIKKRGEFYQITFTSELTKNLP